MSGTVANTLIFFHFSMTDPVVFVMRVAWMFSESFGLSLTAASGIMVNHYVSAKFLFTYIVTVIMSIIIVIDCKLDITVAYFAFEPVYDYYCVI